MPTTSEWELPSAEQIYTHLIAKAAGDPEFRRQIIADPKNAFRQEFGFAVPDHVQVHVHESDLNTIHLGLPPSFDELDEERLETVSTGSCVSTF